MTEFCQNFQAKLGVISSVVNGVKIELNIETLGKILKTPIEGYDSYIKGKGSVSVGNYLTGDIVEALGGQRGKKVMSHNDLSPINKLLFNLVKKTILPRTPKKGEACLMDMAVIFCISKKTKVNFPSLMYQHLAHYVPNRTKVGYEAILSTVFENAGVVLKGKYGALDEKPENVINEETLAGLSLKVVQGKIQKIEKGEKKKEKVTGKRKEKVVSEQPVRKSRSISVSAVPQTSMEQPLELDVEENILNGQVAELVDRMERVENQMKDSAGKLQMLTLEKMVQEQGKELKELKKLVLKQNKELQEQKKFPEQELNKALQEQKEEFLVKLKGLEENLEASAQQTNEDYKKIPEFLET